MKRVLSLFSGCGGMDIGFEGGFSCLGRSVNTGMHPDFVVPGSQRGELVTLKKTGFHTVFANDIRPAAKEAWVSYFSKRIEAIGNVVHGATDAYHLGSVVDLVMRERAGERIFPRGVSVVTGGFPCQDFSVSGLRRGFDSNKSHNGGALTVGEPYVLNRGQLYMWMREVVTIAEPLVFVAENVKGLTNLSGAKEVIERDFASAGGGGYIVVPAKVLNAADYGVPQRRERAIFFGFKKSALLTEAASALSAKIVPPKYDPYPPPTHAFTSRLEASLLAPVTCAEAFANLAEPEVSGDLSQQKYSKAKYLGNHLQGQSEVAQSSVGPTIRSEHHGNIEFRRLSAEHGGKHAEELAAGLAERRLTVRECARLQTFPDEYSLVSTRVSASEAYKLVGNAVPPLLAYHIAMRLASNWELYFGEGR